MPAPRTHRGRRRLLAAALWASAHALVACTDGIAQPIFPASIAGAHSNAGRGAAGQGQQPTAGSHNAADGGAAGSGVVKPSQCDYQAANWNPSFDQNERILLAFLNDAIMEHRDCAGHAFSRPQLESNDALRCLARTRAAIEQSGAWGGKPPSTPGHSNDPFSPMQDMEPIVKKDIATYTDARNALLSDPQSCSKLNSPRYTSVGIGNAGQVWVVALGSD